MNYKRWIFPKVDKTLAVEIADDCGLDPLVVLIACARGLTDPYEIEQFFSKEPDFSDPYEYSGISEAVERINIALEEQEKIIVFGDYDCDGVTSTALLTTYLKKRGADVSFFVPDREKDGYGISVAAIERAAEDGVTLIITVDNGINAVKEVERANELGVDVVITDHHLLQGEVPNAVAVVDPHIDEDCDWIFSELCGVGVAFKLVCALDGRPCEEMIYEYADLVALGTIADIAVKLLTADNSEDALYYAGVLDRLNTERQTAEQDIFDSAVKIIEQNGYHRNRVIVVDGCGWHVGVIGIAAS